MSQHIKGVRVNGVVYDVHDTEHRAVTSPVYDSIILCDSNTGLYHTLSVVEGELNIARLTYQITIDKNDDTEHPTYYKTVTQGDPYGEIYAPLRTDGYTFDHWINVETGETVTASTIITATASHIIQAVWKKEEITYTVNYYANYPDTLEDSTLIYSYLAGAGSLVREVNPEGTVDSHTFDGWYTDPSAGTQVFPDVSVVNSDMNLYAHWKTDGGEPV